MAARGAEDLSPDSAVARLGLAQQKLVEIAKALTVTPRVLIMDEPSAALSRDDRGRLLAVIGRLRSEGIAVVYISHDLEEIFEVSDRITVLRDGAGVATLTRREADRPTVVALMVGRPVASVPRPDRGPGDADVLVVRRLGATGRFEDVSFSCARGEIVGLYGLVGSGRTALARCLFGADRCTAGEMLLHGRPYRPRSPREARQAGVAMLTEDRRRDGLVDFLSVCDNVSLPNLDDLSRLGVLRCRYQRSAVQAKVRELHVRPPDIHRPVRTLSGGNQQKVALAKWLLTRASLLILDEPTTGVDIAAKEEIHGIIADLAAGGLAILLISSDLPEILRLSDRVLVMRKGRLVGEYPRGSATQASLLARATGQ